MRGSNGGPPTSRRKVCRTGIAVIVFVQLARCTLVAMAEADFHVVKPVSCQQDWGIRDGTRICSAAMIFQGAVRTGKEQVAMRSFVLGFA